jgi:hypothetical protein
MSSGEDDVDEEFKILSRAELKSRVLAKLAQKSSARQ